jgi:hypothetical protein
MGKPAMTWVLLGADLQAGVSFKSGLEVVRGLLKPSNVIKVGWWWR